MTERVLSSFEKLNGNNYGVWSIRMKLFLVKEGLWEVIEHVGDLTDPLTPKDMKAFIWIVSYVEDSQLIHISANESGREAWKALKKYHHRTELSSQIRVMKKLFKANLEIGGDMENHLSEIFSWLDDLTRMGAGFNEKVSIALMLSSLNNEYQSLVTALEAWDENRLTKDSVRAKLLDEWRRKSCEAGVSGTQSGAFRAINRGLENQRFNQGFVGQQHERSEMKRGTRKCYNCGGVGHIQSACSSRGRINNPSSRFSNGHAVRSVSVPSHSNFGDLRDFLEAKNNHEEIKFEENHVSREDNEINDELRSAKTARYSQWYASLSMHNKDTVVSWIVDSGASVHMCNDRSQFVSLCEKNCGNVTIANGDKIQAKGYGKIKLNIGTSKANMLVTLNDVLFIPDLDTNLVSVKRLTEREFCVNFRDKCCYLSDGKDDFCIARYKINAYELLTYQKNDERSLHCIHELHNKLAHRNLNDINLMRNQGLKIDPCKCSNMCEACIQGKMSRKPFKTTTKNLMFLDCVSSDICGPMPISSLGGSRYFITFTDHATNFTNVYFLRNKHEATVTTIRYIERLKTQFEMKPKIFRTDGGGEYTNKSLQKYLLDEGIKFQCTAPYSPQQNGVAERKNRTLMEATKTMMIKAKCPKYLWAEALDTANFTFNRIPNDTHKCSPYELVFRQKCNQVFYEFGAPAYVMIPQERRNKLDSKAEKMKFMGYSETSKALRFLSSTNAIKISRDYKFVETKKETFIELTLENNSNDEEAINELEKGDENPREEPTQENADSDDDFQDAPETATDIQEENLFTPRRSTRPKKKPERLIYACSAADDDFEPNNFEQAVGCTNRHKWARAMQEEIDSLNANETWTLVDLPPNKKVIGTKWVYKIKRNEKGEILRYKARLVAQGFTQKFGVDFDEVFAPVARSQTFRTLLSYSGSKGFCVKHFDVKTAFLNGTLEEEIYIRQPKGFNINKKVFKLHKSLYGLKQAARVWNQELHQSLLSIGFYQSDSDSCLYYAIRDENICYLLVHVDDIVAASNSKKFMDDLMNRVKAKYSITDLGEIKHYLGMEVERNENGEFCISQSNYIMKIAETAGLSERKTSNTPLDTGYYKLTHDELLGDSSEYRKLIGCILYVATHTRPDIAASVSILSQKVESPTKTDLNEVKRVIRYLKGTSHFKLRLNRIDIPNQSLFSYSDANWAEDPSERKSNSGYACIVNGGIVSWSCRRQDLVALSSTESEYVALCEATKETTWLQKLCKEFDNITTPTELFTDSQSCTKLVTNEKLGNRTKHIDIKYNYTKDMVKQGVIKLTWCSTEDNLADMMTKPLGPQRLAKLRLLAGLQEP